MVCQTYYLTLELSYPEFKERAVRAPHHSRGGYYKKWMDHSAAFSRAAARARDDKDSQDDGQDDGGEPDDEDDDEEDADAPPLDPQLQAVGRAMAMERRAARNKREAKRDEDEDDEDDGTDAPEDIQILDLHSANPIISYRGRVFEGEWAEMIGTEVILARHSKGNPLPSLRNLADKVDVLAASSSRIMTREKVAKPRVAEADALEPIKDEWSIRLPRGKDKTGERALQAGFLEKLIALKMKKGNEDLVTVYAMDGEGKDWDDRRGPDYERRAKRRSGPRDEAEDGEGPGRRRRRKTASGRGRGGAAGARGRGSDEGPRRAGRGELSVPTPSRWEELAGGAEEKDGSEAEDVAMTDHDGRDETA